MRRHSFTKEFKKSEQGFILPIVIIVGLIIGAGLMALSARTFAGLMGSIRQGQSREAREIAESGMAIILKELNRNYPYLLIEDCAITSRTGTPSCNGWTEKALGGDGTFSYRTSICPRSDAPPQNIFPKLAAQTPGGSGQYRLLDYNFSGDQHQGGFARIKVMGQRLLSDGSVRATAYINQEVVIRPKNCNVPAGEPSEVSGFPGLLGETIDLGNNDVEGSVNGNVLCTKCDPNLTQTQLEDAMGIQNNGIVEGNLFGGQIAIPDVPTYPTESGVNPSDLDSAINESTTINAGEDNGGRCHTVTTEVTEDSGVPDSPILRTIKITHCKVSSITLSGNDALTINTSKDNQVRLYVDGDISIGGNTTLSHTGNSADFAIFGKPRSEQSTCTQNAVIGGGGSALNLFLFMPDACVGINGGSGSPDVYGAVWARDYNRSNSNNAEIVVPDDMGSLIWQNFGSGFDLGIREYAALGTTDWSLVQAPSP